jgi:hypothetical protein
MFQIVLSDDADRLGNVVLHLPDADAHVPSLESAGGERIPFLAASRALADHVAVRSPERVNFSIRGRNCPEITLLREDADGAPIWIWRIGGAEHAAPDLATAISEVLIWFARNASSERKRVA